jgi:hypothetical protein
VHLKFLTKHFEKSQNGSKIQNGVKNQCFRIFIPKSSVFNQFQKTFLHSKRLFIVFCGRKKDKIQPGDLVQDGAFFFSKNRLFSRGPSRRRILFYLPHMDMEYDGRVLVSDGKNEKKKKKIAYFHVLGLFIAKNMI